MATSASVVRERKAARRGRGSAGASAGRPSVREVCLLGGGRGSAASGSGSVSGLAGDRLTWAGRVYRVEATQAQATAATAWGESRPGAGGYVHLALAAVADGGSG